MAPTPKTITLEPGRKQGDLLTFPDLGIDTSQPATFWSNFSLPATISTYIYGLKGKPKDTIYQGLSAEEYLAAGDGNDVIRMGGGDDVADGQGGNDFLDGEGGDDILLGGDGDDTLQDISGFNYLDGGAGIDTYNVLYGVDTVVNLTDGTVTVGGTLTNILVNIENITGSSDADTLIGDAGVNEINSGSGGGATGNTIVGMGGNDVITVGTSALDNIYWASGDGTDTIIFFDVGGDGQGGFDDQLHFDLVGDQSALSLQELVNAEYINFIADPVSGDILIQVDVDGRGDGYEDAMILQGYNFTSEADAVAELSNNIVDDAFVFV